MAGGGAAPRPGCFPSGRPAFCAGLLGNLVPSHFAPPWRHSLAGWSQFLQNVGSFTAPAPPRAESRELGGSCLLPELQAVKVQWGAGQVLPGSSDLGLRLQLVGGGGKGAGSSFSREGSESMSGPNVPWKMGKLRLRENGVPLRQTSLKPWRELLPPTISQPWLPWARRGRTGAGGSI